ncbi:MAG: hypothetical protein QOK49_4845 [Baekduia sp.]|nr:hypothetical protein [Baekduia sp.]
MVWPLPRARVAPVAIVLAAVTVAALSLLLGSALRADPLGWLRWGRAIALADGPFSTVDYPSWKPLPVLLTVPLAFCGALGPTLWLVVVRAAGILSFVLVFDLGRRRGGWTAGIVAAGAVALIPTWWPTMVGGGIEPLLVLAGCLAIDRHERGRDGQAVLLLGVMAMGREEALGLLLLAGLCLGRRDRRWVLWTGLGAVGVLALWLTGDWLGSGDPLHGGELARSAPDAVALRLSGAPLGVGAGTVAGILTAPVWLAAGVGAWSALRSRDRTLVTALVAALAWIATDLVMAGEGFPLPARFLFPPAVALSIVAGVGATVLLDAVARGLGLPEPAPEPAPEQGRAP